MPLSVLPRPKSKEIAQIVELSTVMPHLAPVDALAPSCWSAATSGTTFVCGLGFEPRTLAVPQALVEAGFRTDRCAYVQPATNRADNEANLPELTRLLNAIAKPLDNFEVDEGDFATKLRLWVSAARAGDPNHHVVLDISAMPSRAIMLVLHVLLSEDLRLTITYAEAASYRPSQEEYQTTRQSAHSLESIGLESGVAELTIPQEYSGRHLDSLPNAILILPSFNAERSRAVIQAVDEALLSQPDGRVHWIVGVPRLERDHWRREAMHVVNALTSVGCRVHEASTFDYRMVFGVLEREYLQLCGDCHITLAPFGSKMQSVACTLFALLHPEVRVMFAVPKAYAATHYSDGCGCLYQVEMGSIQQLRQHLDCVGSLKITEITADLSGPADAPLQPFAPGSVTALR